MKLSTPVLNEIKPNLNVTPNLISITLIDVCSSVKDSLVGRSHVIQCKKGKAKKNKKNIEDKKEQPYLDGEVIRGMLNKFLFEKKMPREKLTQILGITTKELDVLLLKGNEDLTLIAKINLPIIKLYCETDFYSKDKSNDEKIEQKNNTIPVIKNNEL
jgi:hypothetical protein